MQKVPEQAMPKFSEEILKFASNSLPFYTWKL